MSTALFTLGEIRARILNDHYEGPGGSSDLAMDLGMTLHRVRPSRYRGLFVELELATLKVAPVRRDRWLLILELYEAFTSEG